MSTSHTYWHLWSHCIGRWSYLLTRATQIAEDAVCVRVCQRQSYSYREMSAMFYLEHWALIGHFSITSTALLIHAPHLLPESTMLHSTYRCVSAVTFKLACSCMSLLQPIDSIILQPMTRDGHRLSRRRAYPLGGPQFASKLGSL